MIRLDRHLLSRTALLLSLAFAAACVSSSPSGSAEAGTTDDELAAANPRDDFPPLDHPAELEPSEQQGGSAGVVDSPDQTSPDGVEDSCPPPDTADARTWLVPDDVSTIQEAIDLTSPGDTVKVGPGTYYEHLQLAHGLSLIGSGADSTILDGDGEGRNLVELVGGQDVLLRGFTLRGVQDVEEPEGCDSDDPTGCSGHWYASALYVAPSEVFPCAQPSITVVENVFEDNDIAMMAFHHSYVVVRGNTFASNRVGFVANHNASRTGLISHNVFFQNEAHAVVLSASLIDVVSNVFVENGIALEHEYVQRGDVSCNVFFENAALDGGEEDGVVLGADGNVEADPLFVSPETGDFSFPSESPAAAGCPG